jgi:hypothetical protein
VTAGAYTRAVLRPNPPRLITVVIAVALVLVGLSATILPLDFVNEALAIVQGTIGTDIAVTTEIAWLFLFAGNALLVAGSLLPGI